MLFVDDGSYDGSYGRLADLASRDLTNRPSEMAPPRQSLSTTAFPRLTHCVSRYKMEVSCVGRAGKPLSVHRKAGSILNSLNGIGRTGLEQTGGNKQNVHGQVGKLRATLVARRRYGQGSGPDGFTNRRHLDGQAPPHLYATR